MESEILSPLAALAPAQEYQFQIDWFAARCPKPILDVTPAGAISKRLKATKERKEIRLEGVFGVFFKGRAEATIKAMDGKVLVREDLGPVDPDRVFRLSKFVRCPENAFRVSVVLLNDKGDNLGVLGNEILK